MLTLVAFLVVISVLVFVHELGHLLAAKFVDIEVPRFSIGFGPRLFGFRIGETEYVLSALPLGGYVKMAGMVEEEAQGVLEGGVEEAREPSPRDFESKPLWARALVLSAGVLMNFLFAFVVYTGLLVTYGDRFDPTTRVVVAEEAPGSLAGVPRGARLAAVGDEAVEGWAEIQSALLEAPAGPVVLRFEGISPVELELPAGDSARVELVSQLRPYHPAVIGTVGTGTPAARAGILPGDRVVMANGAPVHTWEELVAVIQEHPGKDLSLVVERDGERRALSVTPDTEYMHTETERVPVGKLGVSLEIDFVHRPIGIGEAIRRGAELTWGYTAMIVGFLGDLVSGDASPRSVGSVLTIGEVSGQAARLGLESFLSLMALISINLAVMNLLPIPVLDGGHLLFLGVEAVRGRPLSLEQRLRLSHVGLLLVIGIMLWALTSDVMRFFGV